MDADKPFGFKELLTHIVADMANAIGARDGETPEQQFARSRAAAHMIMGFLPRDAVEAMLAGHCVMFHELLTDSVRQTLRGEDDATRRRSRSAIVAMNKAFRDSLARLEQYRSRPSEGERDAEPAQTTTPKAEPAPSKEAIAACRANPEAMAALDAGDAERFARAMGIARPSDAFLAAAARAGSPFMRPSPAAAAPPAFPRAAPG